MPLSSSDDRGIFIAPEKEGKMEVVAKKNNVKVCVKAELMDAFFKTKDFKERVVIAGVIYRLEPLHR